MTVAYVAPNAVGESSGNLKCKTAGAVMGMRLVAPKTGTVSKLHMQFRNVVGDGTSYYGGTGGNFVNQFRLVNTDGTPDMTGPGLLASETFTPADARIVNYSGYVNLSVPVERGREYAILASNSDASPGTNYASWNFLYTPDAGSGPAGPGIAGANGRNERSASAADVYYGLDPRECVIGSTDSGATWHIPGGTDANPDSDTHIPVYLWEYNDGSVFGQPYFSATGSGTGTWTWTTPTLTRPWNIQAVQAWISGNGGSTSCVIQVNGVTKDTVTVTGSNGVVRIATHRVIYAPIGSVVTWSIVVDPTGAAGLDARPVYTRSPQWTTLASLTSGSAPFLATLFPGGANYYAPPVYPLPFHDDYAVAPVANF